MFRVSGFMVRVVGSRKLPCQGFREINARDDRSLIEIKDKGLRVHGLGCIDWSFLRTARTTSI